MHARNRIAVPHGVVEGHAAAHSGAPCGPFSTTFNRRSRSKMAQAGTIWSQGHHGGERGRVLPGTFPRVFPQGGRESGSQGTREPGREEVREGGREGPREGERESQGMSQGGS